MLLNPFYYKLQIKEYEENCTFPCRNCICLSYE
jgi:hypothetical protein